MAGENPAADVYAEGLARRTAGDDRGAVGSFLMAFALAPDVVAYRQTAFEVLNVLSGYNQLPPAVMTALERAAQNPTLDLQPLSLVVRNLFAAEPRLPPLFAALSGNAAAAEDALCDAGWLLEHALVLAVLGRAINISLEIENIFTSLRRHLCMRVGRGETSLLLTLYPMATSALVQQCIINRCAWRETAEERAAMEKLSRQNDPDAVLLRAAYRPLSEIRATEAAALPRPIAALWTEEADERIRAERFPELTAIAPGLSKSMREQYEIYPYPRWRQIDGGGRRTLRALLAQVAPLASFDPRLDGDVEILVAGCGTGLPALSLALGLARARLLAVDLSRASLAYAARMADTLGADNISFAVADILNLAGLNRLFDFIECSGVLHHMADPAAGLAALRPLLHPHGVMKIALYSARGRAAESAAQNFVKERGFPDSADGLRIARAAIVALPPNHPARAVVDTPDFFTRDGLHDLVFNIHESRTSPAAMKRLLANHGLEVIGLDVPPLLGGDLFKRAHPAPQAWVDLNLWETFEATHPHVFAQMIQVWCRPIGENR